MEPYEDEDAEDPVPESMREALRSVSDKAARLGLHVSNVMVLARADAEGKTTPVAFIDFVIGDLAYSPAVQEAVPVASARAVRELEDSLADDEFEAIRRRRQERRSR